MDVACFHYHLTWIDWNTCPEIEFNDTNKLFDKFFTVVNDILDTYAPYKKLSLREIKPKNKPWQAKGIFKSVKLKNRLYQKISQSEDEAIKTDLRSKFKSYRNYLNKITRLSEANHY